MKPTAAILTLFLLTACASHPCQDYLSYFSTNRAAEAWFRQGFFHHYAEAVQAGEEPKAACRCAADRMVESTARICRNGEVLDLEVAERWTAVIWGRDELKTWKP